MKIESQPSQLPRKLFLAVAVPVMIVAAVLAAYQPAFEGDWLWDDDTSVWNNPVVVRKGLDGLRRIWLTSEDYDFWPMTKTGFWLQWQKFGKNPAGYHATNILLHALASVMVYFVFLRLKIPAAPFAGLIYALHPVNVSSVAWIAELKNPLSMIFAAAALLLYLRFDNVRRWRWYALALGAFACALTSKTSIVMFPLLLPALAWWRRGRIGVRDILESAPFFLLSAMMGLLTVLSQHRFLDVLGQPLEGIYRLAGAGWAVWFYLYKALVPIKLSMIYPHWKPAIESLGWVSFLPAAALLAIAIVLVIKRKTFWARPLLMSLGVFVAALLPVLGFVEMSFMMHALVADHFQYVSLIAVVALVCGAAGALVRGRSVFQRRTAAMVGLCVIVALGFATWRRAGVLSGKESLWRDTISKNENAWMAYYNLGTTFCKDGEKLQNESRKLFENSQAFHRQANTLRTRRDTSRAAASTNQANLYSSQAQAKQREAHDLFRKSVPEYERSVELQPLYVACHNNLAATLVRLGRVSEGVERYRKGIEIDRVHYPQKRRPVLLLNLGGLLMNNNRPAEAIKALREAYEINPMIPQVYHNFKTALRSTRRYDELIAVLQKRLEIESVKAEVYQYLAVVYLEIGQSDKALECIRETLSADLFAHFKTAQVQDKQGKDAKAMAGYLSVIQKRTDYQPARTAIMQLMTRLGHTAAAARCYERVLKTYSGWVEGFQKLAWIRATHPDGSVRNGGQALAAAKRRLQIGRQDAIALDTLAAALAEVGQFTEAQKAAKAALGLATQAGQAALAEQISKRIELYSKDQPYREAQ